MASYQGSLDKNNDPQNPINLQLVNMVMGARQQRFDYNQSQYDQALQELKLNENILIRPEDKQYFAEKTRNLIAGVNKGGTVDWANSGLTRQINSHIKQVLDDDYIIDQMGQSSKIRNFYTQVEEKRKKNPELYSDVNFNDAIKQAGLNEYMQGVDSEGNRVDSVGNLQYKDYIDAPKVLNESVAKWAKDHGYKTVIDSENKGYYFENTKREVLTKDEILNYIGTVVDPNIQGQLQINARSTFGNMGDKEFNDYFKQRYEFDNKKDEVELAKQKALEKIATGADVETVKNNISALNSKIQTRKEKIQQGTFSRNEQYSAYQKDLFNNIADSYDRNTITDIDYNTIPLEIAKFEFDKEYKIEKLRLDKLALDKKNSAGQSTDVGTPLPEVPNQDENKKDDLTQIRESFMTTQAQLRSTLENEDEEYRALQSKEAKDAYLIEIVKNGGKINPKTQKPLKMSVINAAANHKSNYEAYSTYQNEIIKTIGNNVVEAFNDLQKGVVNGSNLKVDNLAKTMPNFAKSLKKGKDFSQLTKEEQEVARYEFVSNALKYGEVDGKEKQMYESYLTNLKKRNAKDKAFMDKAEAEDKNQSGLFSGLGDLAAGAFSIVGGSTAATAGGVWQTIFQGKRAGVEQAFEGLKGAFSGLDRVSTGLSKVINSSRDNSPIAPQDTNITELEGRDTGSGKDIWNRFTNNVGASIKKQDEGLTPYLETLPEKTSYSFSTQSDSQKETADILRQIVLKNGDVVPADGANNYDLSYDAATKKYAITYLAKSDNQKVTNPVIVDAQLMPKLITNRFYNSEKNWTTSKNNPKAKLPVYVYDPPYSATDSAQILENFNIIAPNTFSDKELYEMTYNPLFYPPKDRFDAIIKAVPEIKENEDKQKALNELVNSTFEVVPVAYPGVGFFADVYKVQGKTRTRLNKPNEVPLGEDYNPQEFLRKQVEVVGIFTNREVEAIKKAK